MDGRLVGINTAIFSRSGGSIGIGFAMPSNMVRAVVDAVAAGGKLVRPWLGVDGQTVTAEIARASGSSGRRRAGQRGCTRKARPPRPGLRAAT